MARRATASVLLLILALAAGCGSDGKDEQAAARARAKAARQAKLVAAGRPVFVEHCALCHTIEGRVAHPTFIESPIPNLDEVKPRAEYVGERVEVGGIDMPTLKGEMSEPQFRAIVAYVTTVSGRDVRDTSGAEPDALALGEQVFRENCQSCHSIDGRAATGGGPYGGTDFNRVKPSQELVMRQALRGIPEEMPSFRKTLTRAQLHAVAVYVTATAGE